jgi:hypothetical protein
MNWNKAIHVILFPAGILVGMAIANTDFESIAEAQETETRVKVMEAINLTMAPDPVLIMAPPGGYVVVVGARQVATVDNVLDVMSLPEPIPKVEDTKSRVQGMEHKLDALLQQAEATKD